MTSINLTAFGRPALWLALRRAWVDWAALLVSLALASLALHWSHVSWLLQLETVAILSVATLAGVFVASLPRVQYPDFILFANAAFVIGVVLLSTSAFVLSHNALFGNVPFGTQLGRVWLGFAVIALIGGAGLWTLRRPQLIFAPTLDARATAILLGAATIVSTAVHISFFRWAANQPRQPDRSDPPGR